MKKSSFQFKQFTIYQDKCAMKVGTDGVLLGAWCHMGETENVLDIGTGTGIVALMLAQRYPSIVIDAVEIDTEAALQAHCNVMQSPFSSRIQVIEGDCLSAATELKKTYDSIVSNPPYFVNSLKPSLSQRSLARHTETLNYTSLFAFAKQRLTSLGVLSLVYPYELHEYVMGEAAGCGMYITHCTTVYAKGNDPAKRVLCRYKPVFDPNITNDKLVIHNCDGSYTEEYIRLTRDFYLRM